MPKAAPRFVQKRTEATHVNSLARMLSNLQFTERQSPSHSALATPEDQPPPTAKPVPKQKDMRQLQGLHAHQKPHRDDLKDSADSNTVTRPLTDVARPSSPPSLSKQSHEPKVLDQPDQQPHQSEQNRQGEPLLKKGKQRLEKRLELQQQLLLNEQQKELKREHRIERSNNHSMVAQAEDLSRRVDLMEDQARQVHEQLILIQRQSLIQQHQLQQQESELKVLRERLEEVEKQNEAEQASPYRYQSSKQQRDQRHVEAEQRDFDFCLESWSHHIASNYPVLAPPHRYPAPRYPPSPPPYVPPPPLHLPSWRYSYSSKGNSMSQPSSK